MTAPYAPAAQFQDEQALEKAERLNCDIVHADDNTLLCDLDSAEARERFEERLLFLQELSLLPSIFSVRKWTSKSGNQHAVVTVPEWELDWYRPDPEQRVLLQALLGSDIKREALCIAGLRMGRQSAVILFKPRFQFPTERYFDQWSGIEDLKHDFSSDDPQDAEILFASYNYEDYEGSAFVLFKRDGKLFEVHGSHCSCMGLEGQWDPEETTVAALQMRPDPCRYQGKEASATFKTLLDALSSSASSDTPPLETTSGDEAKDDFYKLF